MFRPDLRTLWLLIFAVSLLIHSGCGSSENNPTGDNDVSDDTSTEGDVAETPDGTDPMPPDDTTLPQDTDEEEVAPTTDVGDGETDPPDSTRDADDPIDADAGTDILEDIDASSDIDDGGDTTSDADADTDTDTACEARTCSDIADPCGSYDDECGGTINCDEGCECTEGDFELTCPQRPCERLAGCDDGTCIYSPVICGDELCSAEPCTGEGCELFCSEAGCDTGLYPCGGALCAGIPRYCDPAPRVEGGVVVYQNVCVDPPRTGCGTCGLGLRTCDTSADAFQCDNPPVPVVESGGIPECDSTVLGSTFIYLDREYTEGGSDGSRARPFSDYPAALLAAQSRGARGIVIAGSPTFTTPLVVGNGISIYGGYGSYPMFNPDPTQRPVWDISGDHYDSATNQLVGARATDVVAGTVVRGITVQTRSATGRQQGGNGASNIGLLILRGSGLKLVDVTVWAGDAAAGATGANGAVAGVPANGGNANLRVPGASPTGCTIPACTAASVPTGQGSTACGYGGNSREPEFFFGGGNTLAGNSGHASGSAVSGGTAGRHADWSGCSINASALAGGNGANGRVGLNGTHGAGATRGQFNASGVWQHDSAAPGFVGGFGTWGGGGGAGGGVFHTCMNDPEYGGHGGGGGAPGCGGDFGRPGGSGGASVAVAIVGATDIVISESTLRSSTGGRGGDGGVGRAGGAGGIGAPTSGRSCLGGPGSGCNVVDGGRGGDGGTGGQGGHGGGGSGGDSTPLYCASGSLTRTDVTLTQGSAGNAGTIAGGNAGAAGVAAPTIGCGS